MLTDELGPFSTFVDGAFDGVTTTDDPVGVRGPSTGTAEGDVNDVFVAIGIAAGAMVVVFAVVAFATVGILDAGVIDGVSVVVVTLPVGLVSGIRSAMTVNMDCHDR
jgi:hypothetical protein